MPTFVSPAWSAAFASRTACARPLEVGTELRTTVWPFVRAGQATSWFGGGGGGGGGGGEVARVVVAPVVVGPVGPTVVTVEPTGPCVVVATIVREPPESFVATMATTAAATAMTSATRTGQIQSP